MISSIAEAELLWILVAESYYADNKQPKENLIIVLEKSYSNNQC